MSSENDHKSADGADQRKSEEVNVTSTEREEQVDGQKDEGALRRAEETVSHEERTEEEDKAEETAEQPKPSESLLLAITIPDVDPTKSHAPESPTLSLIDALRQQINLLADQSNDLNSKLITNLDRVANLEDDLEHHRRTVGEKDALILELQAEKTRWEESMNTGLLVERGTVRDEMQRLVEGLVEEEKRRGSAEEGRKRVEREVDDLSATLFEQANTMVASERMQRAAAEQRMKNAEENLAAAEAAMRDMQLHLQSLPNLLPAANLSHQRRTPSRRYLASHVAYFEFIAFVQHLRQLRPIHAPLPPPQMSTLLSQPFIARAVIEDVDPTLRLDNAPDLSWLTRRNVGNAIVAGDLLIEPVSLANLLAQPSYASSQGDIGCSLCGRSIFPPGHRQGQSTPATTKSSRFSLKPFFNNSPSQTPQASPSNSPSPSPYLGTGSSPIFAFRATQATDKETQGRLYPLCASGWCLSRLRAVCEWWRYLRLSLVDAVWKVEDGSVVAGRRRSIPPPTRPETTRTSSLPRKSGSNWALGFRSPNRHNSTDGKSVPGSPLEESKQVEPETEKAEVAVETEKDSVQEMPDGKDAEKAPAQSSSVTESLDSPAEDEETAPMESLSEDRLAPPSAAASDDEAGSFRTPSPGSFKSTGEEQPSALQSNVDLASPRPSGDQSPAIPPRRRPVPQPPVVPPRQSLDKPSVVVDSDPADQPVTPEVRQDQSMVTPTAPPLPARRSEADAERADWRWLSDEDSWENKSWKEVIRLKEEMWKARVGMTDE